MNTTNEEPDFSGDDLANEKGIQEFRKNREEQERIINSSLEIIRRELKAEETNEEINEQFPISGITNVTVIRSFRTNSIENKVHILLAEYSTRFQSGRSAHTVIDQYLLGFLDLKKDFPNTFIQKETLKDKIIDLFVKAELDFEHAKLFSSRFHVITEDNNKLTNLLQLKDLDILTKFQDMEVELNGKTCFFRSSRKPISIDEATNFSELAKTLIKILN